MKIAITGNSGFIGTHLCAALSRAKNQEHEIVELNRTTLGDFHDVEDWGAVLAGCDAVVHLAGRVHRTDERTQDPAKYERDNVTLTENILDGAINAGVKNFVFLSTAAVYGSAHTPKSENAVLAPTTEYGRSKAKAEDLISAASDNIRSITIRPPLIYGKGCRANFMALKSAIRNNIPLPLRNVKNERSFLYIENLCSFIEHALQDQDISGIYNLADNDTLSTPALIQMMADSMGKKRRLFPFPTNVLKGVFSAVGYERQITGLTGSFVLDINKVKDTSWRSPVSTREGLRRTLAQPRHDSPAPIGSALEL